MQVRLLRFGSIEVEGREYHNDIVIEGGRVRKRKKKPSKPYRDEFGHTPVSADEELPWGGGRLSSAPAPTVRYRSCPRSSRRLVVGA
jgi:hypothetical protein